MRTEMGVGVDNSGIVCPGTSQVHIPAGNRDSARAKNNAGVIDNKNPVCGVAWSISCDTTRSN